MSKGISSSLRLCAELVKLEQLNEDGPLSLTRIQAPQLHWVWCVPTDSNYRFLGQVGSFAIFYLEHGLKLEQNAELQIQAVRLLC